MSKQVEKVKLVFASGRIMGIVEVPKYYRSPDVVVWEHQGTQAFVNTDERDEETGFLIYEHRLTVSSSTTFEDAVKHENTKLKVEADAENNLEKAQAIFDRLDRNAQYVTEKVLVEDLFFLFLDSYLDWVTESDKAAKTQERLTKVKKYHSRLRDAIAESVDPSLLKFHLWENFSRIFEKVVRLTSIRKYLDLHELSKVKTDGSFSSLSDLLSPDFFVGM